LLETLRERDIPLEICITSNVVLGAVSRLEDHPVRRIFDAGVPITLNTDDPGMFRTTLTREFEIAAGVFGFTRAELEQLAANGFRYAFRSR
jgi:adenosine deaminase